MKLIGALLIVLCAGCAIKERVVLLPESDGKPTAVSVQTGSNKAQIDKPYQASVIGSSGEQKSVQYTAKEVQDLYPGLIAASMTPEKRFVLYFQPGGSAVTVESMAQLPDILRELNARAGGELLVVGHTDAAGTNEANDRLSQTRADSVATLLVENGVKVEKIETVGRGKRELLVPTADGVAEPRNRRVEVRVR
jgi:OOP family OmpA-OmpF porin